MIRVQLNADLGESFGPWRLGEDEALIPFLHRVNIACGLHAGDWSVMRRTVALARAHGVAVGAHPGYPDLQGFGRRSIAFAPEELQDLILYQIGALAALCRAEAVELSHVKLHGALYHDAARDPELARCTVAAIMAFDRALFLIVPPHSALLEAAAEAGLPYLVELFADRAYRADGTLLPRSAKAALITDPEEAARRALAMLTQGGILTQAGTCIPTPIDTLCIHADTPNAVAIARRLRETLNI